MPYTTCNWSSMSRVPRTKPSSPTGYWCSREEGCSMTAPDTEPVDVRPTDPAVCALAFAIPTTVEGFARDLGLGRAKDFAYHASHRPRVLPAARRAFLAENLYRSQSGLIAETIEAVGRQG